MNKLKHLFFCCFILLAAACKKEVTNSDLTLLNGYWEIEKVKMPDGTEKDYSINTSVDYFEINEEGEGFRQKLIPQFTGEYLTNDIPEKIRIEQEGNVFWMNYKTDFAKWKEQLIKVEKNELVVKNEHDIIYYYKKTDPENKEDTE